MGFHHPIGLQSYEKSRILQNDCSSFFGLGNDIEAIGNSRRSHDALRGSDVKFKTSITITVITVKKEVFTLSLNLSNYLIYRLLYINIRKIENLEDTTVITVIVINDPR